jgi:hypothetical protein
VGVNFNLSISQLTFCYACFWLLVGLAVDAILIELPPDSCYCATVRYSKLYLFEPFMRRYELPTPLIYAQDSIQHSPRYYLALVIIGWRVTSGIPNTVATRAKLCRYSFTYSGRRESFSRRVSATGANASAADTAESTSTTR